MTSSITATKKLNILAKNVIFMVVQIRAVARVLDLRGQNGDLGGGGNSGVAKILVMAEHLVNI